MRRNTLARLLAFFSFLAFALPVFGQDRARAVSQREARALFDELASRTDIAWNYAPDGCYARAHLMVQAMLKKGLTPGKAWTFNTPKGYMWVEGPGGKVSWCFHVAPTLPIRTASGTVDMVLDPSLFDRPVTVDEWAHAQHNDPEVVKTRLGEGPRPDGNDYYPNGPSKDVDAAAALTMKGYKKLEAPAPLPSARAPAVRDFFYRSPANMPGSSDETDMAELEEALLTYLETPPTTDYARKLAKRIRAGEVDMSLGAEAEKGIELPAGERFAPMAVELVFRGAGEPGSVAKTSTSLARAQAFIAKKELPGEWLAWSNDHETPFLGGLPTDLLDPRAIIERVESSLNEWISGRERGLLQGRLGKILGTQTRTSDSTIPGTRTRGLSDRIELRVGEATRGALDEVGER